MRYSIAVRVLKDACAIAAMKDVCAIAAIKDSHSSSLFCCPYSIPVIPLRWSCNASVINSIFLPSTVSPVLSTASLPCMQVFQRLMDPGEEIVKKESFIEFFDQLLATNTHKEESIEVPLSPHKHQVAMSETQAGSSNGALCTLCRLAMSLYRARLARTGN